MTTYYAVLIPYTIFYTLQYILGALYATIHYASPNKLLVSFQKSFEIKLSPCGAASFHTSVRQKLGLWNL